MKHRELLEHRRQRSIELFKVFEREHFAWDLAEYRSDAMLLIEEIGAKARNIRNLVAEIDVTGFFELLDLKLGSDLVEHFFEIVIFEWRMVHPLQLAIDAEHGVVSRGQVQVRSLLFEHQIEECVNFSHKLTFV